MATTPAKPVVKPKTEAEKDAEARAKGLSERAFSEADKVNMERYRNQPEAQHAIENDRAPWVDFINADGTPHINYNYRGGVPDWWRDHSSNKQVDEYTGQYNTLRDQLLNAGSEGMPGGGGYTPPRVDGDGSGGGRFGGFTPNLPTPGGVRQGVRQGGMQGPLLPGEGQPWNQTWFPTGIGTGRPQVQGMPPGGGIPQNAPWYQRFTQPVAQPPMQRQYQQPMPQQRPMQGPSTQPPMQQRRAWQNW